MKAIAALAMLVVALGALGAGPVNTRLRGYTFAGSERERDVEARFADIPSAARARDIAATVGTSAADRVPGTPGDRYLAIALRDAVRQTGLRAELEPFAITAGRKPITLWNVVARIAGAQDDQSIVIGADRVGSGEAADAVATLLEIARGLGELAAGGWQPQRSVVITVWDGQLGWLDYINRHQAELDRGCVAYLDVSGPIGGSAFAANGAAALAPVLFDVSHRVADPSRPSATFYDRWSGQTSRGGAFVERPAGGGAGNAFLAGSGVPVAGLRLNSDRPLASDDPTFALHRAAAQFYGLAALRLADADVVPYALANYVALLRVGLRDLRAGAARVRASADLRQLVAAVDRFTFAVVAFEPRVARAEPDVTLRELQAVHDLDTVVYRTPPDSSGGPPTAFETVLAQLTAGQAGPIDEAIARAAATISHAAAVLDAPPHPQ